MKPLYEITAQYSSLNNLLDNIGEDEKDCCDIESQLQQLQGELKEKSINIASAIKNIENYVNGLSEIENSIKKKKKSSETILDKLKTYLKCNLENVGISKIESSFFNISIKKNPVSVVIEDEKLIPEQFMRKKEIIEIDKIKIKNSILSGEEVLGASVGQSTRLEIK